MKKIIFSLSLLLFFAFFGWSQETSSSGIPLLGDTAPSFTAESTNGQIVFPSDYSHQWKILFSHPADFTPVCTSEIIELAGSQKEFEKLNTKILIVSSDGVDNHNEWIKSMEALKYKDKNTEKIKFPLIGDKDHLIAKKYGMIHPSTNTTKDVRGVFIIDPNDKVRAIFFYPMNVGRNVEEIKRTLIAMQTTDKEKVMTPANWEPGGDVLIPYSKPENEKENLAQNNPQVYQVAWYMWFKKLGK
jgi:peroxiredoxin 2/4